MDPVVHFEMPAGDTKRVADFYNKVFGWQMQQMGTDMGNYLLATTTPLDEKRMPTTPGAINGGFYPLDPGKPQQPPHVVISIDDLAASMKKVADAGGKIQGEPMDIPGIGKFIMFTDTEGNCVGMLQPVPMK